MKAPFLFSLLALAGAAVAADSADGWQTIFNGSLDGWKASEAPGTFAVVDGALVVRGERSHLFYVGPVANHDFKNFEVKAEVMAKAGSNSGFYFHTAWQETGWPDKGFEVQVNNTHKDPKKTAGLYSIKDNLEAPAKDGEWFTLSIRVEGKRVVTMVNDKVITEYMEPEDFQPLAKFPGRKIGRGTFAIQGHDPASEVHYKNIRVKVLP